jgi:hypothetical protein
VALLLCALFLLSACTSERARIISGAKKIAELPSYATHPGSSGSAAGKHYVYQGDFYIDPAKYTSENGSVPAAQDMLWDIFKRFDKRVRENIPFDQIPDQIAQGGSVTPDPKATHYQYKFDSADVSVHYDVEWVAWGCGPEDWAKGTMEPRPEIRIMYHIRVN